MKTKPFLYIIFCLGLGSLAQAGSLPSPEVRSPYPANAVSIKNIDSPLWLNFSDDPIWYEVEDLILHENTDTFSWTACDPSLIEPKNCLKNGTTKPEFSFIDTGPSKFAQLKNWVASYRGIIRQVGGTTQSSFNVAPPFRVQSRSEWGANESWRYTDSQDREDQISLSSLNGYPDIDHIVYRENGHNLWWPLEYVKNVKKIVIHHTATAGHLSDPAAGVRAIYLYHAVEKDWGDIGYHYIVSQNGEIFSGRAGGDNVVGGHTGGYNIGSIGIAVLGTYETQDISPAARESLTKLVEYLSQKYSIDTGGQSDWYGLNTPNLLGHRDLSNTSCPGTKLYRDVVALRGGLQYTRPVIPEERDNTEKTDQSLSRPSAAAVTPGAPAPSVEAPRYEFEVVSGAQARVGRVGDTIPLTLILKNTGNITWSGGITLKSTRGWQNPYFVFETLANRDKKVATAAQKSVAPSGTALFRFSVKLTQAGSTNMDVFPVWTDRQALRPIEINLEIQP